MSNKRLIGVTVLPEYAQSEGVEAVLDNLINRAKVTAVATSPYVMQLADEQTGGREPPIDAGAGAVRLLDRPLWGERELWVRTAPSFIPKKELYDGLRYQPAESSELTHQQGQIVDKFIDAAHERRLEVYFQVQSAIPPGYRVQFGGPVEDDAPRLPNGRLPPRRVANNASLASDHVLDYQDALIRDICRRYPSINAIRFDWPEYPPYLLDSVFFDFSHHAQAAANRLGFDFDAMRNDVGGLYDKLNGGLSDDDLTQWIEYLDRPAQSWPWSDEFPQVVQWLNFKAMLVDELLARFHKTLNEASDGRIRMAPSAFPPPWSYVSGMDFERVSQHCDEIAVKLYGMHWAMMLRFYGDQICEANPELSSDLVAKMLTRLLDIADDDGLPRLEDYKYPGPDEPHPIGSEPQIRKIQTAQCLAGDTPIHVLAHGYGPIDDFSKRIKTAVQASSSGVWVNRYGYLNDEKLDAIGRAVAS